MLFAPVLSPPDPDVFADRRDLLRRQMRAFGSASSMMANYTELLRRANRLTTFIRENVGNSTDWPVILQTESEQTLELMSKMIDDVESSVAALTEL